MQDELVMIKGKNDRIEIILSSEYDYFDLKNALYDKLDDISKFLGHSNYKVYVAGKHLTEGQKREISSVMRREHGLSDVTFCSIAELNRLGQRQHIQSKATADWTKVKDDTNKENGSIFKVGNVRGGQQLQANGDITVVGDVNPGAELVARGNICVMGALRGNAHAGAFGDDKAIIVANILEANQLRISDCIGIAPKDNKSGGSAEVASISEKRIIIEPLSDRRNKIRH